VQQGRRLLAVEWQDERSETEGNRQLLSQGAEPLRGLREVPALCQSLRGPRTDPSTAAPPPSEDDQLALFE
jgi:predicted Rossmann fold nucleotide-binding protein DprA/Smf involved in DNA uptake